MPPLVGTAREKRALAVYLAHVGGASREALSAPAPAGDPGQTFFEANCAMCHGPAGAWPLSRKAPRTAGAYYELLGRLPEVNEMMPPFTGSDADRRAVAAHLASLAGGGSVEEVPR
jgi:mono/diheme cytochrome c family protein